ncbi:MAG: hypothetical protein LAP21_03440 [Acidobacteriia bacterium]|nr:hypothetical protein [Terriglobia bacterium]
MTDWVNTLFGVLTAGCFLGAIFTLTWMLVLAQRRRESGRRDSNAKINRLSLGFLVLGAAGFTCWAVIDASRNSRAGLAGMALFALISIWKRSRTADAASLIAPVSLD